MNENFLRDFFGMRRVSEPEAVKAQKPRTITIECYATDPLEVRAENIVKIIGFEGGAGNGWYSSPTCSPAEATLRALKVLRKYAEADTQKSTPK